MSTHNNTPEQLELPFTLTLPLTRGYNATVDEIDSDLGRFKWRTQVMKHGQYAVREVRTGYKTSVTEYLHRTILSRIIDRPLEPGEYCDHINSNCLDNRRSNLRLATPSDNAHNQRKKTNNTSGYKGVSWSKGAKKWHAYINANGKRTNLGYFTTPELAYAAYCEAAKELHGEFARLD